MSLKDEMSQDFLSVWEEVPISLLFEGVAVRVLLSQNERSQDLDLGGFAEKRSMSARALRSSLPGRLDIGALVSVAGQPYRVENISYRTGLPLVTLELTEP